MNRKDKPEALYGSNGSLLCLKAGGKSWLLPLDFNDVGHKRGGMFAAFPFGSNARKFGWNRHGPLRDTTMVKQGYSRKEIYTQKHPLVGTYEGTEFSLDAKYTYEFVNPTTFGVVAEITQTNDQKAIIPSNFGFHPYFKCPDPDRDITVSGHDDWTTVIHVAPRELEILKKGLGEKINQNQKIDIVIPGQGSIRMHLEGFSNLYMWRDRNDFICVEPTETKIELFGTSEGSLLHHGKTKVFKMYLEFHPEE